MQPVDDTPTRYVNRMRRLARIIAKGLQLEFVHTLGTARLWEEALRELLAVVDEWRLRWPEWMEEPDYVVWQATRYLVEQGLADFRAITDRQSSPDLELAYSDQVVEATYRTARHIREVVALLRSWKHKRGDITTATDWRGELGWFVNARTKLRKQIKRFSIATSRTPAAGASGDDLRAAALRPYFDLCEVSRRTFQLFFLVLTVCPWQENGAKEVIQKLCHDAHKLMPDGRLRLAVQWRIEELQKLLPTGRALTSLSALETDALFATDVTDSLAAFGTAYEAEADLVAIQ